MQSYLFFKVLTRNTNEGNIGKSFSHFIKEPSYCHLTDTEMSKSADKKG